MFMVNAAGSTEHRLEKSLRFYESAEPLFVRFGFKKTTIEDICAASGMSKRTFYEIFNDKSDFFARLLINITEEMVESYKQVAKDDMSACDKLNTYLDVYFSAVRERPVFKLILEEPKLMSSMSNAATQVQFASIIGTVSEIIQEGIESGEFREVDSHAVTWIIHSLLDGIFLLFTEMHPTGEGSIENSKLTQEVRAFILAGLGVNVNDKQD
jgi:AcrR family transcriptional regulator